ncbi:MAG: GNAT family N-acetyltransferase [Thermodesulfobacteriota bacterium]
MLDIVLEERYPKEETLDDGSKIMIRPMSSDDKEGLIRLFKSVPEAERVFLQHDVMDPKVIEAWCRELDYFRVLPLLAIDGDKVVGNASLKQQRRGWMSHIGNVRVVVGNNYRRKGVARRLIEELIHIALNIGLVKLDAEFMLDQTKPIETFEKLGFVKAAVLPGHVWDQNGEPHDYVLMVHDLRDKEYFAVD